MAKGLFITGTDTEVGKTYVTCQLIRQYRRAGVEAVGMKPVASGLREVAGRWQNEDIEQIWQAADGVVERELINQFAFRAFIAPHLAAAQVDEPINMSKIIQAYQQLQACAQLVVVEGAGGLLTPLNESQSFVDLAQALKLDVILVVAIRLGCINHALLTQQAILGSGLSFAGWVANYPAAESARELAIEKSLDARLSAPLMAVMPWCSPGDLPEGLDLS